MVDNWALQKAEKMVDCWVLKLVEYLDAKMVGTMVYNSADQLVEWLVDNLDVESVAQTVGYLDSYLDVNSDDCWADSLVAYWVVKTVDG